MLLVLIVQSLVIIHLYIICYKLVDLKSTYGFGKYIFQRFFPILDLHNVQFEQRVQIVSTELNV